MTQSSFRNKSNQKFKNSHQIREEERSKMRSESSRAMEDINRYKLENDANLSTPERKKDLEKMELRIAALLKTSS